MGQLFARTLRRMSPERCLLSVPCFKLKCGWFDYGHIFPRTLRRLSHRALWESLYTLHKMSSVPHSRCIPTAPVCTAAIQGYTQITAILAFADESALLP